jgi:7-cyano-7-deazaguanine tRNA-ribosyltransferase
MLLEPDTIFDIKQRSLWGRIGRIKTKKGYLETPTLFPVLDIKRQLVDIETIRRLGFKAVMTNAYILFKRQTKVSDIHHLLNFDGIVATDSGAYQILEFGNIQASQEEIIRFQEGINVDIGVILDTPTGKTLDKEWAKRTVDNTISNAAKSISLRERGDILWIGPIQGGEHLDLIEYCTKKMADMPFHIHGLGSPTEFLEGYKYDTILEMILHSKKYMPPSRPLHLFGAGHPAILPFFVALGVDLFDSASYALFARNDRYLTPHKTYHLDRLIELPCKCNVCSRYDAKELRGTNKSQRERLLAEHNLSVLAQEIARIRLAIYQGTLWDLLQSRIYSHPQIFQAFKWLTRRTASLARGTPITAMQISGLFAFTNDRPEARLFRQRLKRFIAKKKPDRIVIIPSKRQAGLVAKWKDNHTMFAVTHRYFGLVPLEMLDLYPVFQTVSLAKKPAINKIIDLLKDLDNLVILTSDPNIYGQLSKKLTNVDVIRIT